VRTVTGMMQDITQQKHDARLLRQSEEKYRHLFDSIDQGFTLLEMIFDGDRAVDYRFVEINPAFERQTGLVNALGRTMRECASDHEQAWFDTYGEVARTGKPLRFQRRADALDRDFDVYAFRVGPADAPKVAVLFADITDRRIMEDALRQADRRKDEFLATLAHELRNPLAPLRTGLELLRRWNVREDAGATLGMMERQVRHLVRMVDDLLDISRISRGKVELDRRRVDLVHEVRVAAEAMQPTYEAEKRTLSIDLTRRSGAVRARRRHRHRRRRPRTDLRQLHAGRYLARTRAERSRPGARRCEGTRVDAWRPHPGAQQRPGRRQRIHGAPAAGRNPRNVRVRTGRCVGRAAGDRVSRRARMAARAGGR
jgi:signal transduction histidine kinase